MLLGSVGCCPGPLSSLAKNPSKAPLFLGGGEASGAIKGGGRGGIRGVQKRKGVSAFAAAVALARFATLLPAAPSPPRPPPVSLAAEDLPGFQDAEF